MIGNTLKSLRERKGLTQEDIAVRLNVKRQTYSAYERNVSTPDANTIKWFANYYEITADELLGMENKKTTPEGQSLSVERGKILEAATDLSPEEAAQVIDYVAFLKSKRNP